MEIKKFLTETNIDNKEYNLTEILTIPNNPNIKSHNNKNFKKSQKIKNFNSSFAINENSKKNINFNNNNIQNKENNFSLILKMLDEEVKKSLEYKKEINSLKIKLSSKTKEIKILNSKINSLMNDITIVKKEKNIKYKNNKLFYQSFIDIMNNFKQYKNIINIKFPKYSLQDEEILRNKNIINTIYILIKTIIDLCDHTNENITQFNSLKDKLNIYNQSLKKTNEKKEDEVNSLKAQNIKLKTILDLNNIFLKELRKENNTLKNRNLNLEKNINLISSSSENMRKNLFFPIRIKYSNNNLNKIDFNANNTSMNTIKTNKTVTDILIEEFQDKENKINNLHKMAHDIYNNNIKE